MARIRFYLEMKRPDQLRPARAPEGRFALKRQLYTEAGMSRWLYEAVGREWNWVDRLSWTDEQWVRRLSQDGVECWVLWVDVQPAGYFELVAQPDLSVEIAYFGLLPAFIGRGLGGYLLTEAVRRAWETGARSVWLLTSSLDHPNALPNYEARGFLLVKVEER